MVRERPYLKFGNGYATREKMAIEIEKKYRMRPELRDEIIDSLNEFGAIFEGEDVEENTIFGNSDLVERNAVVRIRRTQNSTILTYKQRIKSTSDAKQQIEFETEVSDAESARSIVESIGLNPVLIYEKRRKKYRFRKVEIVFDVLPFGLFMEIEGPISAIAEVEMLLGIEDLEVEPETYPRLTMKLGTRNGDVIESRF
jgi:adenylate cyclase, class 2